VDAGTTELVTALVNPVVVREVVVRGLAETGRIDRAAQLVDVDLPGTAGVAAQWLTIERVTAAEVHRAPATSPAPRTHSCKP